MQIEPIDMRFCKDYYFSILIKSDQEFIQRLVNETKQELKSGIAQLRNQVTTFEDKMSGRLDTIDAELAVTNGHGNQLVDYEERITKLVKPIKLAGA